MIQARLAPWQRRTGPDAGQTIR